MLCPYCSSRMLLKDSSVVYGKSFGDIFVCEQYPACDTYVGTHKAGHMKGQPLGTPANAELRNARKLLHEKFDPLWKHCYLTRGVAYQLLAKSMQIPEEECHIAMFNLVRCREAWKHTVELHKKYYGRTK
jgi:hypothetical protein